MATYAQLKKQIEQLAKQAEAALRAEKDVVLAKVREAVSSFSLSVEEVFGTSGKKKGKSAKPATAKRVPKGAGQAKYADPKTGATWSGFGRAPGWIASAKDRTKFLVNQSAAAAAPAPSKAVKPVAKTKAAAKATKAPAAKTVATKTAKAPAAAPAKKAAKAAPTAKAKAAAPAKKAAAPVAAKKAVSKASAPAKKAAAPKAKTVAPATVSAAAPAPAAQA